MASIKKLSNGVPVILEVMPNVKSVSMGLCVKVGSKYESEIQKGLSHLLEHMVFKGTAIRNSKQISESFDTVGGEVNAFTTKEITVYYFTVLDTHMDFAIDILSDMYLNSIFPEEELKKEKGVIAEEIKMYEDLPEDLVHDLNVCNVLKDTNLSSPILGSYESLNSITREDIINFYNHYYSSNNMFISIAGNIDEDKVIDSLEMKFKNFTRRTEESKNEEKFYLSNVESMVKKDVNQVHLCVNTQGLSYLSEDIYKLHLISNIIGGGMSSRLFQEIRENRGLAYSVYSYLSTYRAGGVFTTYVGTTPSNYREVISLIYKEYENLENNGINEKELQKAKNQIISGLVFDIEGSKSQMLRNLNLYFSTNKVLSLNNIIEKIQKISMEDVKVFCKENFNNKYYSFTAVGNI